MKESNVSRLIRLAVSKFTKATLFRNNVGTFYAGDAKPTKDGGIFIENPRRVKVGLCEGFSDLIGWTPLEITEDMVGKKIAVFTALEIKSKSGRNKPNQLVFLNRIKEAGGISGIAKDEESAVRILTEKTVL